MSSRDGVGGDPRSSPYAVVSVPEIRDYTRINPQVVALLNAGHARVHLSGVDGQRLLLHGLKGTWNATITVEGDAGPELAAEMDAPGVVVCCTGSVADGAARSMQAGGLIIAGHASMALGYGLRGGTVILIGDAGPRLGLEMQGGTIFARGNVDRLAGDRQRGGNIIVAGTIGTFVGRGRTAGRLIPFADATEAELAILRDTMQRGGDLTRGLPNSVLPDSPQVSNSPGH